MTSSPLTAVNVYSSLLELGDAAMRVLLRRSESLPITLQGRVTSATPVPEAPDFMNRLTIKRS